MFVFETSEDSGQPFEIAIKAIFVIVSRVFLGWFTWNSRFSSDLQNVYYTNKLIFDGFLSFKSRYKKDLHWSLVYIGMNIVWVILLF